MAEPKMCAFDKSRICNEQCVAFLADIEVTVSVLERPYDNGNFEWATKGKRIAPAFCIRMERPIDNFSFEKKLEIIEGGASH